MSKLRVCFAAAIALACVGASAQPFKCVNEQGKTIYSDQRCDNTPAKKAEPAPVAKPKPGDRYQLTAEDQARIKTLEAETVRKGSSNEQKEASILEVSAIRSGQDSRLSESDRAKRDALKVDLASPDAKKRVQALRELRNFYSGL